MSTTRPSQGLRIRDMQVRGDTLNVTVAAISKRQAKRIALKAAGKMFPERDFNIKSIEDNIIVKQLTLEIV